MTQDGFLLLILVGIQWALSNCTLVFLNLGSFLCYFFNNFSLSCFFSLSLFFFSLFGTSATHMLVDVRIFFSVQLSTFLFYFLEELLNLIVNPFY